MGFSVAPDTELSDRFFRELFTEALGEPIDRVAVTNSVLCLPRRSGGRHLVKAPMLRTCSEPLRRQIELLDPLIVAPVGRVALDAARRIEDHCHRSMAAAVGRPTPWLERTLFPLYHTGLQVRNGPSGRKAEQQRQDWGELRRLLHLLRP